MKRKNLLLILGLLLIASLMITACGGGAEEPAAPEAPAADTGGEEADTAPAEKTKVVVFVGLGTGTDPDQIAAQEALAAKFNEEHGDIEMEFLIVPNEESNERLLAMVSGGNPPDLVGPGGVDVAANSRLTAIRIENGGTTHGSASPTSSPNVTIALSTPVEISAGDTSSVEVHVDTKNDASLEDSTFQTTLAAANQVTAQEALSATSVPA